MHLLAPPSKEKTAVLVALITPQQPVEKTQEYLQELAFLAFTWGLQTRATFVQRLSQPHGKTFIGKGKLAEIVAFVQAHQISHVLFDDDLSPAQVRNLEQALQVAVLDRSLLILHIFAMRAKTTQAKIQVELAQYQYLMPRLKRMWVHLSRQQGGNTGMRGPGEKELETDQRAVQNKLALLRKRLKVIEKQTNTQRKTREGVVRVALVGYTNVGKSTLMQLLSKTPVLTENKLFATIDSTVRNVVLQDVSFLLTDTVGFIRKLPHTLIACFKSTLAEVGQADILLHVVDVSHPACEEQQQVVTQTLQEIGAGHLPIITVLNKIDLLHPNVSGQAPAVPVLPTDVSPTARHPVVAISATQAENILALTTVLCQQVAALYQTRYPYTLSLENQA